MKVKDLYKKYKDYSIQLFGKPLEEKTIPFTFLPYSKKELNDMIIKDIKIEEKEHNEFVFDFYSLELKRKELKKGYVYAYCIKED